MRSKEIIKNVEDYDIITDKILKHLKNSTDPSKLRGIQAMDLSLELMTESNDDEKFLFLKAAMEIFTREFPDVDLPLLHPKSEVCHICPEENMIPINEDWHECAICSEVPCEGHSYICQYISCEDMIYCLNCVNHAYGYPVCLSCYDETLTSCGYCGDKIPLEDGVSDPINEVRYCSYDCLAEKVSIGKCRGHCQKHGIGECYYCDEPACQECGRKGGLNQPKFFHRHCLP